MDSPETQEPDSTLPEVLVSGPGEMMRAGRPRPGPPPIPVAQRFWTKVEKSDGCWLWTGTQTKGYGMILGPDRIPLQAHRVAWRLTVGDIPLGFSVLHHCDVPLCVNPAHLWLGTQADNLADARKKGRRPTRKLHLTDPAT